MAEYAYSKKERYQIENTVTGCRWCENRLEVGQLHIDQANTFNNFRQIMERVSFNKVYQHCDQDDA